MAAQPHLRPRPGSIPTSPGVYRFRDSHGRVIYVGKAKNLRARLSSYFQDFAGLHPRTQSMVSTAADVDWTVVGTEVEALQLEYSWIKEYDPRFNVKYRDDKSYPYLAVTMDEEFPRVQVMRGAKRKGVRYFGPYGHAWAIRETVDLLLRVFPVRTCSAGVFRSARNSGRPCLLGYIGKCAAPCVGRVDPEEHRHLAEDFCSFMAGDTSRFIRRLEQSMREAAAEQEYERAARIRDDIQALRTALEKQAVVLGDSTDCDVIAIAEDQLEAAAQVFYVRGGRIRGQRGWVVDKVEDVTTGELVERFLAQTYGSGDTSGAPAPRGGSPEGGDTAAIPREVLVSAPPADRDAVVAWLTERRGAAVDLRVPQRGDKKALLETVAKNAEQALARHKTQRAGDLTTRSRALSEIQDALGLDEAPLRIECFDISNLMGEHVVASMVVFEDGLARKSEYRRFSIRGAAGGAGGDSARRSEQNDVAAMHEVIKRRFSRYLEESSRTGELDRMGAELGADAGSGGSAPGDTAPGGAGPAAPGAPDPARPGEGPAAGAEAAGGAPARPAAEAPAKFAYPPNLVVVDGGRPQVQAARRALDELGIDDIAVCGLAKRLEEVWLPDDEDPVILPRTGEGLYLLQRVRDEAHRFAITYHRQKRAKALTGSALDDVPGLGPARRTALLKHFGSVKRLAAATEEEIAQVPGIGKTTAGVIHARLSGEEGNHDRGGVGTVERGTADGNGQHHGG
ncbi:excinuclease ABC subunit UvrC [Streptomonospora nanhaiensis]|uniref:excinuclease ABC subunit UvrC n=1 Tax=Streptomonospora nanhaiensis TaxID=1323731 RepID=UPI001C380190|nr:excinuclease ABC subunit UvrC [Streptomonospora nanhaiensis]MBV2365678.1 excinuclease ABC subunit UvrC [Streptomonospora nanhaiensis]MBX9388134.1 excinuclease ABC subunit UvrC [Streptomonospora nanhaiensis]